MSTNVNLGRIKGAGFFTSTASSSTSVAISTIAPTNITPLVGDSIVFPNGDVRRVTAKSSTTITCGAVVANIRGAVGAGSNPNLLINSNFAINQRDGYFAPVGATVYADDLTTVLGTVRTAVQTNLYNTTWRVATSIAATLNGSNITISTGYIKTSDCTSGYYIVSAKTYCVDRTITNRSVIEPIVGGGIKFNIASGQVNPYIQQIIENAIPLVGEQLTLSAKIDGIVYSHTITTVVPSANSTTNYYNKNFTWGSYTCNLQLTKYKPSSNPYPVLQLTLTFANPNDTIINWWKLEVGDVATEYTPPLIAEELPKCQRYYYKNTNYQGATYSAFGLVYGDGSGARMSIERSMRTQPTVSIGGSLVIVANGQYKTVSSATAQTFNTQNVVIKFTLNSAVAEGICGYIQSNNDPNAYIALDSEIY